MYTKVKKKYCILFLATLAAVVLFFLSVSQPWPNRQSSNLYPFGSVLVWEAIPALVTYYADCNAFPSTTNGWKELSNKYFTADRLTRRPEVRFKLYPDLHVKYSTDDPAKHALLSFINPESESLVRVVKLCRFVTWEDIPIQARKRILPWGEKFCKEMTKRKNEAGIYPRTKEEVYLHGNAKPFDFFTIDLYPNLGWSVYCYGSGRANPYDDVFAEADECQLCFIMRDNNQLLFIAAPEPKEEGK